MSCTAFKAVEQPPIWDHKTTDNVYIKQLFVKAKFTIIPQHSHKYSHTTLVAAGSVRVWADGVLQGDFVAPSHVLIAPKVKHTFQTLEPNTLMYCVHNVDRTGEVEIHEEHQLKVGT